MRNIKLYILFSIKKSNFNQLENDKEKFQKNYNKNTIKSVFLNNSFRRTVAVKLKDIYVNYVRYNKNNFFL